MSRFLIVLTPMYVKNNLTHTNNTNKNMKNLDDIMIIEEESTRPDIAFDNHMQPLIVGRSPEFRIKSKMCSRAQVEFTPNLEEGLLSLKQVGKHPCKILSQGVEIHAGGSTMLVDGDILALVSADPDLSSYRVHITESSSLSRTPSPRNSSSTPSPNKAARPPIQIDSEAFFSQQGPSTKQPASSSHQLLKRPLPNDDHQKAERESGSKRLNKGKAAEDEEDNRTPLEGVDKRMISRDPLQGAAGLGDEKRTPSNKKALPRTLVSLPEFAITVESMSSNTPSTPLSQLDAAKTPPASPLKPPPTCPQPALFKVPSPKKIPSPTSTNDLPPSCLPPFSSSTSANSVPLPSSSSNIALPLPSHHPSSTSSDLSEDLLSLPKLERTFKKTDLSTKKGGGPWGWKTVLEDYVKYPEANKQDIFYMTDKVIVVKDAYPKSRYHYLLLPRILIRDIHALRQQHAELIKDMQSVAHHLVRRSGLNKNNFKTGFHAIPSLTQVHMHLVSKDFDSECLTKKKHWNSFTTKFFLSPANVYQELLQKGKIELNEAEYEAMLEKPLRCHVCNAEFRYMPLLKTHILSHFSENE